MSVARSMSRATFSRPCVSLMLSTTVSICGNVLNTCSRFSPRSNGVKRFGSKVSVDAMPPAIQRTMTVSAVGLIFSSASAFSWRGNPTASAESVAALAVFRNSRRLNWALVFIVSINELKFRQHDHRPQQVLHALASRRLANHLAGQLQLLARGLPADRFLVNRINQLARHGTRLGDQLFSATLQNIRQRFA